MRSGSDLIEQKSSILLTKEENSQVFQLLGPRCQSLATAVIQLFMTSHPDHSTWHKKDAGILCLVKDNQRKSYFFRLYCLMRRQLVWEQEVYNNIDYQTPRPFLHSFEAEDSIAAFNFASPEEGHTLKGALMLKLQARQRRTERRNRSSLHSRHSLRMTGPITNGGISSSPRQQLKSLSGQSKRKDKDSKRRLTKADIGSPQNFRHVSHVGWDPNKGFDLDNVEDPQLKTFFKKAGVSDSQLQDRETREFIYDFINSHGGLEAVKEEIIHPPPVPARSAPVIHQRTAPPPPPSRTGPLPPPHPPQPPSRHSPQQSQSTPAPPPPPPPEPYMTNNNTPPPPPPPPPPVISPPPMPAQTTPSHAVGSVGAVPDTRSALMDAIRSGTTLKHVEVEKNAGGNNSRGELLDQIRQGVELKSVQHVPKPAVNSVPTNSLAGALARALADRNRAMYSDTSTSSGEEDDDDEWED